MRSRKIRSLCMESILRKRVYSFKHSGNSRGAHRRPEIVSSDCRSGLKMNDFLLAGKKVINFLKAMQLYKRMGRLLTIRSTSVSLSLYRLARVIVEAQ